MKSVVRMAMALALCAPCCAPSAQVPTYAELAEQLPAAPLGAAPAAAEPNVFGDPPAGHVWTTSEVLHLMFVAGPDVAIELQGTRTSGLEVLTSASLSTRLFGDPALMQTPHGLRYPPLDEEFPGGGDEGHRGLCLSALAHMGVSLDQGVECDGKQFTLRDVLRDSLAEFHESQEELEWTAAAFARWLPPHTEWRNRFGMHCSLTSLVRRLLARPLRASSCGGTHCLAALSTVLDADARRPFLPAELRSATREQLESALQAALVSQSPEGAWDFSWLSAVENPNVAYTPDSTATHQQRLLVTGHLAQWLGGYRDRAPVSKALAASTKWLCAQLDALDHESAWSAVCPVTHALLAVRDSAPDSARRAPFRPRNGAMLEEVRPGDATTPKPPTGERQ